MKLKTIEDDEEFLRQISSEVDFDNDDYVKYVDDLKNYCIENEVYAMSPVQIGNPKRIIYIKNSTQNMNKNVITDYNEGIVLINPVILKMEGKAKFLEGCQSCMTKDELMYVCMVDRPYIIEVEYYDINKNKKKEVFEGFKATVICHEFDHLNGILHMDRSKDVMLMEKDDVKSYREKHTYEILSKSGEFNYKN